MCLDAKRGAHAGDVWLANVRLARTDLEDETRQLPLGALHMALRAFEAELPKSLVHVAPYLIVPENLGMWARLIRGVRVPEEAFARLDSSDSEHGRTTRWEAAEARSGFWRGRVRLGHDPALEADGLLASARMNELSVVPQLFGFHPGVVTRLDAPAGTQVFEVRWAVPMPTHSGAFAAAVGAAVGIACLAASPSWISALVATCLPLAFGLLGVEGARIRRRRIDAAAQALRVHALERSLAIRESEGGAVAGDLEGSVLAGQYRIGSRMGSGASGVIYRAARITDGLAVAVKLLRAATAHDAVASDRLRREAEALGLSWHPNVVEVIDHGHLPDGTSYLVMELLEGEPLAACLKRTRRLTPDELLPIAIHVAEAVVAIHAAGVVHRDLKPANIFLTHGEDGVPRAKILDFGIARIEWEEMRITNIGAPLGTPGYMSPEQESGGEIDVRSDVYAIGAVLYECLVGEPPPSAGEATWTGVSAPTARGHNPKRHEESSRSFRADSGVQPASRRMPSVAPAPYTCVADVPSAWRSLIERALARNPEARFQDARGLLSALRILRGESVAPPAVAFP